MIHVNTDATRIFDIARNLLSGYIAIPSFQRDYVWGEDQVQDLIDSINQGWPLGNIILVQRAGVLKDLPLKEKFSHKRQNARYMILDGAQRS